MTNGVNTAGIAALCLFDGECEGAGAVVKDDDTYGDDDDDDTDAEITGDADGDGATGKYGEKAGLKSTRELGCALYGVTKGVLGAAGGGR